MAKAADDPATGPMPIELTAPAMQRLARKGLEAPLSLDECRALCACVLFHVEIILERRRIPNTDRAGS